MTGRTIEAAAPSTLSEDSRSHSLSLNLSHTHTLFHSVSSLSLAFLHVLSPSLSMRLPRRPVSMATPCRHFTTVMYVCMRLGVCRTPCRVNYGHVWDFYHCTSCGCFYGMFPVILMSISFVTTMTDVVSRWHHFVENSFYCIYSKCIKTSFFVGKRCSQISST